MSLCMTMAVLCLEKPKKKGQTIVTRFVHRRKLFVSIGQRMEHIVAFFEEGKNNCNMQVSLPGRHGVSRVWQLVVICYDALNGIKL